ncbi:NAD(P)/FAD-dependent oxidoreductase [Paramicrobacterium sp. CJ85]|uniref:NAD(P)/FAD-dependent oxidoreductase n=1 Tax=Paramicrobacterium sp. CJ85 TaxID=3445355 RepID=UPI003F62ADB8
MSTTHDQVYDVAIIGGGSAGLSAALILARARRSVVAIDGGAPRNAPASAAHGLLGQEGVNPLDLLEKGRAEAASYGARIVQASVMQASGTADDGFTLALDDGARVRAAQVLIATGVRDELPGIPGLTERWGRDVVHCPYCHGWEIRDQRIGLLATGPMSAMQALLFHQWSEQMTFLPNGLDFPADQLEKVRALGITIAPGAVSGIEVADDRLTAALVEDGSRVELDALAVPATTRARLDGLESLGVDVATNTMGVAVVADAAGHTSVPGVWAAGNVVNPGMQVSESAANGARVAMTINTEMVFARADRAVANEPIRAGA